jgi:hypothetical protein
MRLAKNSGMNSQEVFTLLSASAAVCVSLGFAVSQYRAWTRDAPLATYHRTFARMGLSIEH